MINSVYGDTIVNLRNRVDVRLISNAYDYQMLVRKPIFASQKIFKGNLVAVHKIKEVLTFIKRIRQEIKRLQKFHQIGTYNIKNFFVML